MDPHNKIQARHFLQHIDDSNKHSDQYYKKLHNKTKNKHLYILIPLKLHSFFHVYKPYIP